MSSRDSIRRVWGRARSPLLMAGVVILLIAVPNSSLGLPSRLLLLVVVLVVAAITDGGRAVLVAGLIAAAYLAFPLSLTGRRAFPDLSALSLFAIVILVLAFGAGSLHRRLKDSIDRLDGEQQRFDVVIREKANFMNAAAHELRTPLTVVLGYLSMLLAGDFGPPPARWQAVLEMMRAKTDDLSGLVEQMLVSARIDAGTIATATVNFDLREAVREAVERVEPQATLAEATITFQLPSRSVMVTADKDHVASILDRLIQYALAAAEGHPWIRITVTENRDGEALVEDRGRAIPTEMQERVFERFVRVDEPRPALRGTPLGLALSRDLARHHAGDLVLLSSESGVGTVFALRLPRAGIGTGRRDI